MTIIGKSRHARRGVAASSQLLGALRALRRGASAVALCAALPAVASAQRAERGDSLDPRFSTLARHDSAGGGGGDGGTRSPAAGTAANDSSGAAAVLASPARPVFKSRADSLTWSRTRDAAARDRRFRVVVSLLDRRVVVMIGGDTMHSAPVAVATGETFAYAGRVWNFTTPRGMYRVRRKEIEPLWTPPDWHYAEVAREHGLSLRVLPPGRSVTLADGTRLTVRDRVVGIIRPGTTTFLPLPTDEEIVFDETLFIPPVGTINRRIVGELGRYGLDLGDGYLLHGTPDKETIGAAATHGCVRLHDEDIEWLYAFVPVGTPVYIY